MSYLRCLCLALPLLCLAPALARAQNAPALGGLVTLASPHIAPLGEGARTLRLDGLFFETASGQTPVPAGIVITAQAGGAAQTATATTADGRTVTVTVTPGGDNFVLQMSAQPGNGILRWGLAMQAGPDEYFTGLLERVVSGPQQDSWNPNLTTGMNLRGERVQMLVEPSLGIYTPFHLSSRGYAAAVQGFWPGFYDFCTTDAGRVWVMFEGPAFTMKIYTADNPGKLVAAHALDTGPPVLPPKWTFLPLRWRDEHNNRATYYDGTPVTGPFNSEVMEDLLMMQAYGIPCGAYWIDRPWSPGQFGYDDMEIDSGRLPNFAALIQWLNERDMKMLLWIGPFFNGALGQQTLDKGFALPGQMPGDIGQNYPLIDYTNPAAVQFYKEGLQKVLKLGVAGFKLDRSEERIPDSLTITTFNGMPLRENRNAYPMLYLKAAFEACKEIRGDDFICMPRAAYTESTRYGVFWGGDIGGTSAGLRASVISALRCAVMGYPHWGSDTGGYLNQSLDQETITRWLGFSCFTPIMEVGPTDNRSFWDIRRAGPTNPVTHYSLQGLEATPIVNPVYDSTLIAAWRLYARLHTRLADYSYEQAVTAHRTGVPILRPLFFADPQAPAAWANWWTYQYGPDLVVSPIWNNGQRQQEVYLPAGHRWRNAWTGAEHEGGQTLTVAAEPHQIPFFVRVGANLPIGDLNREWAESVAIAQQRPNLAALDAEMKAWFDRRRAAGN